MDKRERIEHMMELLDLFIHTECNVHFIPMKLSMGSYVHFEYCLFYEKRPMSKAELADTADWWLVSQGLDLPYSTTIRYCRGKLTAWIWEEYKNQVHDDIACAMMVDRPKIEFANANGRPRKDGSRTIYIRHKHNVYQRLARNGAEEKPTLVNERRKTPYEDDEMIEPLFLSSQKDMTRLIFKEQGGTKHQEEVADREYKNGQADTVDDTKKSRAKPNAARRKQRPDLMKDKS